jgi:hypothetical protein
MPISINAYKFLSEIIGYAYRIPLEVIEAKREANRSLVENSYDDDSKTYGTSAIDWRERLGNYPLAGNFKNPFQRNKYQKALNEYKAKQAAYQLAQSLPELRRLLEVMIETGFGEVARPLLSILDMVDDLLTSWAMGETGRFDKHGKVVDGTEYIGVFSNNREKYFGADWTAGAAWTERDLGK